MPFFSSLALERNYSEKRDFIRMQIKTHLTIREIGAEKFIDGITHNLSGNGILFETEQHFEDATRLEIAINPVNESITPLMAIVEVVRTDPCEERNSYLISAKIIELRPD